MTTHPCPACGGTLELVTDGEVGVLVIPARYVRGVSELRLELQPRPFLACTACEYCATATAAPTRTVTP